MFTYYEQFVRRLQRAARKCRKRIQKRYNISLLLGWQHNSSRRKREREKKRRLQKFKKEQQSVSNWKGKWVGRVEVKFLEYIYINICIYFRKVALATTV